MAKILALSVLIPTYNHVCTSLVEQLLPLLQAAAIRYEVIVADDGSTDKATIESNRSLSDYPNCMFIQRKENVGRAAIRNFLSQAAHYDHLLFIDSDMTIISDYFIQRYLSCSDEAVVDGGVNIEGDPAIMKSKNLRYIYEKAEAPKHTASQRQQSPYQHLHTANLLIRRDLIRQYPFDERFRHYGYEDVLLGKTLRQHHIPITHIDNPIGFCYYESNSSFVAKTEEGLRTLYQFQNELRGYSRLLKFIHGIHIPLILKLIRLHHRLFKKIERKNLCGSRPNLTIFKLYRLGYFLTLK